MTNINHHGNFEIAASPEKIERSWNFLDNNRGNNDPTRTEQLPHRSPQHEHKSFENHKPSKNPPWFNTSTTSRPTNYYDG
jgi:hypothetical protein